jgi:acetoin:2,6-dichlorophenolindophenol oxidoreductase subunit beta
VRQLRYVQALNEALHQEFARDESVIMIGEDIRENMRGETKGLFTTYGPERVLDSPISEAAFTGFATGAAMAGLRPIAEFQIPSLVYVAFDQLANQAAKLPYMSGGQTQLPITYIVMGSGARGNVAGQHSDNPYPFLIHAGIKVVIPSTAYDMKGLATAAIRDNDPVAIFGPAACLGTRSDVPEESYVIPLGKGEVKREGTDVTVVAVGHLVHDALKVADQLSERGLSIHVWDPRTLLPLDRPGLLSAVRKTGRVVIFDDSNSTCGYGAELSAVIAELAFDSLKAPIKRVSRAHVPIPFSVPLEIATLPTMDKLIAAIESIAERSSLSSRRAADANA